MTSYNEHLIKDFGIKPEVLELIDKAEAKLKDKFDTLEDICAINQLKVLNAFQENNISDTHFSWNTGYGYDDAGRNAVENVYASIFNTESALVRPNIVNGTHALSTILFGLLKPGEELIYVTGRPYDTLQTVIGINEHEYMGTLTDYSIQYSEVALNGDLDVDLEAIKAALHDNTRVIAMQRSTGYDWRPAITLDSIRKVTKLIHEIRPDIIVMVDNCYGEFVKDIEPTDVGVDIIAGSLIKNPGGGLALSGGYVCAGKEIIDRIAYRLTCPGIGSECGLTFGQTRNVLQGIFLAPRTVNSAVKAAMLCAKVFEKLGFDVCPNSNIKRNDIIQAICLRDEDRVVAFCQGIQAAAPIDSHVVPLPWDMPGYEDKVVMAAGSFVQGSSIELSADAPIREPYNVYFQGGLTYEHAKFGVLKAADSMYKKGLLSL